MTIYRSFKRLVIEVEVTGLSPEQPWVPEGAALLGGPGEVLEPLSVSRQTLGGPDNALLVWVELGVPPDRAHRTFELKLWDAGRAHSLTLPGVKLP